MKSKWSLLILILLLPITRRRAILATAPVSSATPTIDPDIYNKVPDTTVYESGQCTAVLNAPAPAYTSNTLGGQPSGEIPAGQYEVGVVADYGSSLWYGLNNVGATNWINNTSVSSLIGACAGVKRSKPCCPQRLVGGFDRTLAPAMMAKWVHHSQL